MKHFSIYIELDIHNPTREKIEEVRTYAEQSGGLHPAIGTSRLGYLDATVTLPADSIQLAVIMAVSTVQSIAGATAIRVDSMTESEFLARNGFDVDEPELIGAVDAAIILGVSRQRVQQLAEENRLPASKVGKSLVFVREDVDRYKARTSTSL